MFIILLLHHPGTQFHVTHNVAQICTEVLPDNCALVCVCYMYMYSIALFLFPIPYALYSTLIMVCNIVFLL